MKYLMGVDGGGTKTQAALADDQGNILKTAIAGSTNYHLVGLEGVEKHLAELLQQLVEGKKEELKMCYLGLSGVGRPIDFERIGSVLAKLGIKDRSYLTNDALIALMGGALSPHGIIIICGTGSIILAIDHDRKQWRAGGWGQFLADEGSGYRIGLKGMQAVMRAYDKRGPETVMTTRLLDTLELKNPPELVTWFSGRTSVKEDVSRLAPLVIKSASEGDKVAVRILDEEIAELALGIKTVLRQGKFSPQETQIIVVGGVALNNPYYFEQLKEVLERESGLKVERPRAQPVVGAVVGAAIESGSPVSPEFIANLMSSWEKLKPKM